ncbi:hypothetical protein HYDPIDRAFT_27048 [Hydnomerulius pinastri MD-312]|nr:hypothetical protein HYDPIDRAFT_27048 [Hydnomerulius pinastri MD-312]
MIPGNISIKREFKPTRWVKEATELFVQEMSNDALSVFLTWGDKGLTQYMAGGMIHSMALSGHFYVATDEQDRLIGYSAWLPRGKKLYQTPEEMDSEYFRKYNEGLNPSAGPVIGMTMAEASKHIDEVTKIPDAELQTYWCMIVVVTKSYQSQGIGSALIKLAFDEVKKTPGLDLALATTVKRNAEQFYPSLGFKLVGQQDMAVDSKYPWTNYVLLLKNEDL